MTDRQSILRELIELEELKAFKEITAKKEDKKPDKKWWSLNPIRMYIILILAYPFIGKGYLALLAYLGIWK